MTRVGLLVPSVNTVVEPEFWSLVPTTATVHAARMRNSTCGVEDSLRMLAHAERAADELGSANIDILVFACTASSFVQGIDGEQQLRRQIETAANAPAVTTSGAVIESLHAIGAEHVSLYTPYPDELNHHETQFLEEHGVETVSAHGLGIEEAVQIAAVTSHTLLELIAAHPPPPQATAIFLSCTNLATLKVIRTIEHTYNLPVVSSNSATFFAVARRLKWPLPPPLGHISRTYSSKAFE